MNKTEQVATINAAAILLEKVKQFANTQTSEELQAVINVLDKLCDNIKRI